MAAFSRSDASEIKSYDEIVERARAHTETKKPRAAIIEPAHGHYFRAFSRAVENGLIEPVVIVGDREKTEKSAKATGFDLQAVTLVESSAGDASVRTALKMVGSDEIDLIVRGSVPTDLFMHALFEAEGGFVRKGRLVSHVATIKPERYGKVILLTDALVNVAPSLKTKLGLVQNLTAVGQAIGLETARIAVLAAVEVVYPQMPVTVDGAVLAKMSDRHQFKGCFVDGPLSFDCAVDPVAAESKGITNSEVAGRANAMLAPNIETAHGIYKAMALYGKAQMGGVIHGGVVPVAIAARSDSEETIFNSIALAVLMR